MTLIYIFTNCAMSDLIKELGSQMCYTFEGIPLTLQVIRHYTHNFCGTALYIRERALKGQVTLSLCYYKTRK